MPKSKTKEIEYSEEEDVSARAKDKSAAKRHSQGKSTKEHSTRSHHSKAHKKSSHKGEKSYRKHVEDASEDEARDLAKSKHKKHVGPSKSEFEWKGSQVSVDSEEAKAAVKYVPQCHQKIRSKEEKARKRITFEGADSDDVEEESEGFERIYYKANNQRRPKPQRQVELYENEWSLQQQFVPQRGSSHLVPAPLEYHNLPENARATCFQDKTQGKYLKGIEVDACQGLTCMVQRPRKCANHNKNLSMPLVRAPPQLVDYCGGSQRKHSTACVFYGEEDDSDAACGCYIGNQAKPIGQNYSPSDMEDEASIISIPSQSSEFYDEIEELEQQHTLRNNYHSNHHNHKSGGLTARSRQEAQIKELHCNGKRCPRTMHSHNSRSQSMPKSRPVFMLPCVDPKCPWNGEVYDFMTHFLAHHLEVQCVAIRRGQDMSLTVPLEHLKYKRPSLLAVCFRPCKSGRCVKNRFLPFEFEMLRTHIFLCVMAVKTSWKAIYRREPITGGTEPPPDESVLCVWVTTSMTSQPVRYVLSLVNEATGGRVDYEATARQIHEERNPHFFIRGTGYLKLSDCTINLLTNRRMSPLKLKFRVIDGK